MKTNCDLKHFKEKTLLRVLYFIEWKRDFYKRFKKRIYCFRLICVCICMSTIISTTMNESENNFLHNSSAPGKALI